MPRKAKPWYHVASRMWRVWWNGRQVSLGVRDQTDESGAWAAFDRLRRGDPDKPSKPTRGPKVSALVGRFLESRSGSVKPYTLRGYRNYLNLFSARFGKSAVASIDPAAVLEHARSRGWAPNNLRNYLVAVELLLKWAGRPVRFQKPARESAGAGVVIAPEAHWQAVGCARGDLKAVLRFLWDTGCRPSEATGLTAEAVDWSAGTVRLREHKTRGKGRDRLIYLSPPALDVLTAQRDRYPKGLLFRSERGTAFTMTGLTQSLWRISKRIGVRVTAYGYRHTYATRALEKGLPDTFVAALLGHTSTRMVHSHYGHLGENARLLKEAAARVSAT